MDEAMLIVGKALKGLQLFNCGRDRSLFNRFYFVGISGNMATIYNVAQVFNLIYTKLIFGKFGLQLVPLQFAKDPMQILHMLLNTYAEHKYMSRYTRRNLSNSSENTAWMSF